jgi:hypothetical protein
MVRFRWRICFWSQSIGAPFCSMSVAYVWRVLHEGAVWNLGSLDHLGHSAFITQFTFNAFQALLGRRIRFATREGARASQLIPAPWLGAIQRARPAPLPRGYQRPLRVYEELTLAVEAG